MNKVILNKMFTALSLTSIDVKALEKNLYYLLDHKKESDGIPSDTFFKVSNLCIKYEKPLQNVPISGLMLYKSTAELSYLLHTQSKNVDLDLVESKLDLDSIDLDTISNSCAELIAIKKRLIECLCDDIAAYIDSEHYGFNEITLASRKFISNFIKFIVENYSRPDYIEIFKLRYVNEITGYELFLMDQVFKLSEDNLDLFKTNRSILDILRGK